jgi:hypothetical protein
MRNFDYHAVEFMRPVPIYSRARRADFDTMEDHGEEGLDEWHRIVLHMSQRARDRHGQFFHPRI